VTHDEILQVPFRDLLREMGLSQTACSRRFEIPLRTIQNWVSQAPAAYRECPPYVRLMMAELTGIWKEEPHESGAD